MSLLESIWQSFMRAVDAGAVGADNGWALRLIMLLVTIGGLFILAVQPSVLRVTHVRQRLTLVVMYLH